MKTNLIGWHGGYSKAKQVFNTMMNSGLVVDALPLGAELLQYRREHNIFEVGDKVIVITNALGNKFTWEVSGLDGCMVEISQIGQHNEWVHYAEIAHATPEEIQANRRLEVCGG